MKKQGYQAVKVMHAIYSVYSTVGDAAYAEGKTNAFLKRCGADINKPKEQLLETKRIKEIVHAMLDIDCENKFWAKLDAGDERKNS